MNANEPASWEPKHGEYAMHHMDGREKGTLVLLELLPSGWFGVSYIPCGGASFSWPASDFKPVTDPRLVAVAKKHAAESLVSNLKAELKRAERAAEVAASVVECFAASLERPVTP